MLKLLTTSAAGCVIALSFGSFVWQWIASDRSRPPASLQRTSAVASRMLLVRPLVPTAPVSGLLLLLGAVGLPGFEMLHRSSVRPAV